MVRKFFVFGLLLFAPIIYGECTTNHLQTVFTQPEQRVRIASFIDNVLRQIPSGKFLSFIDDNNKASMNDMQWYEYLYNNIHIIKNKLPFLKVIKLINFQKNLLAEQIHQLLGDSPRIANSLEIGTPGTYTSSLRSKISGTVYVAHDQERMTDLLQAHSLSVKNGFRGYDNFVALNNYEPLDVSIADNSIDLVICFIGLHHISVEKIDKFVDSLFRVMRPGGVFLLREHDAFNADMFSIVYAAHSIYNAVIPHENLDSEMSEIRNFKPLSYWIDLLERKEFNLSQHERLYKVSSLEFSDKL